MFSSFCPFNSLLSLKGIKKPNNPHEYLNKACKPHYSFPTFLPTFYAGSQALTHK